MKRQVYINTWHGGGAYKRVGAAYQKETPGKQIRAEIAREVPCTYVSSSNAFTELTIHQSFHHDGTILSCGMPRNDMLFNNDHPELHDKIRAYYHLLQRQRSFYTPLLIGNQKRLLIIYSTARQFNLLFQKNLAATGLFYSVHTTLL